MQLSNVLLATLAVAGANAVRTPDLSALQKDISSLNVLASQMGGASGGSGMAPTGHHTSHTANAAEKRAHTSIDTSFTTVVTPKPGHEPAKSGSGSAPAKSGSAKGGPGNAPAKGGADVEKKIKSVVADMASALGMKMASGAAGPSGGHGAGPKHTASLKHTPAPTPHHGGSNSAAA